MTVTDHFKILNDEIKSNQVQCDLGGETAKISTLSSKDLLEKHEYLTGEDLGHKFSVLEKAKFEYSPLGMTLINNTKNKTNKNKAYNKNKQNKYLIYNPVPSFANFKDIAGFEELSLDFLYQRLNELKKRFNKFKTLNPQTGKNKNLQEKVLDDAGNLFNELYYIYKDKYNEEKYGLYLRERKNFNHKKLRFTDDYQYESKEEREQQTSKKPDKKELPKKRTKDDLRKFNEWINKNERDKDRELFKRHFSFQRPNDMLKVLYSRNDKMKNNDLVIEIKCRLSDLKKEIEKMSEEEKEIEKPNEILDIFEKIFRFNDRTQRGQGLKIFTPNQMLSRLLITLAQLKAGNRSIAFFVQIKKINQNNL